MFLNLYRKLKFLTALVITLLFVLFAAVNREFIAISLFPLPYEIETPKFLLAIICFAAGLLVGGIVMSFKVGRIKRLAKKEHKQVMALQNEVQSLHSERTHVLSR